MPGDTPEGGGPRPSRAERLGARRPARRAGREASDPHFSQPVRQIVLMLIVLVLVAAGAWFAYRQILPIFAANPLLNGAILLVFALGVLTCFWQVGQLITSVSWIERFAAGRFGYGPMDDAAPDAAPRLLAPLAALLGARGPSGGAISTESARSIQESVATRIDEARDITRYLANLLIFLGLLGTFYGLATTVPAIVDTIRTLAPDQGETGVQVFDKLMHGLETQLGGMATAFSSSLLGLAGSLVVGLLELFASHGQNRFYRELEEWLSSFTRIGLSGGESGLDQAALVDFLDGLNAQFAGLQDYYASRDTLRDEEASDADARSMALAAGVERLAGLIASDRDALAGQLAAERQSAAQAQERLAAALSRLAEAQEGLNDRLSRPPRDPDLAALAGTLSSGFERLGQGQERLLAAQSRPGDDRLFEDLTAGLEQALARFADGQDRLVSLAQAQPRAALPDDVARALARLADMQAGGDAGAGAGTARALNRLAEGQARLIELAETRAVPPQDDPEARMRLRSIDVQLGRLLEDSAAGRDGLIAELREDMAALTRAIRALEGRAADGRHGA